MDLRGALPTRRGAERYFTRDLDGIVGVTIHYTASSPYATPETIARHQVTQTTTDPFPAIAYTLIVDWRGTVHLCHDLETRCWHSGAVVDGVARNRSHVGICWIGSYHPAPQQLTGMRQAIQWCERKLKRRLDVEGHSDSYATACPGPTWPDWKPDILTG